MGSDRLVVRCKRVEGAPVVALRVWLRGGSRNEELPGQSLLSGRLLSEGTATRDWRQIASDSENRGMSIASFGDLEVSGLAVDALASDWELAVDWAAELTFTPSFPADRCDWAVRQAAGELAAIADHPDASTGWAFLDQLYSPHPAGRPLQGDPESLSGLDPATCAAFHDRCLRAGAIVTVAGTADTEPIERRIRERFAALEGSSEAADEPPAPAPAEPLRRWPVGGDQAHLFLGRLTVPRSHPALPALRLLAVILGAGSGLGGRLPSRVREREGLAYATHVDTAAGAGFDPGRFVVYVGTSPKTVDRAIACVREELDRLIQDGVTEEEIEEARSFLLGREPFRRETARQWADLMGAAELYGQPLDDPSWVIERLRGVERADIERVAAELLRPEEWRITVGAPAAGG